MARDIQLLKNLGSFLRGRRGQRRLDSASARPAGSDAHDSVERLAGGVAHDFNNIMLVVRGYTELALGEQDMGPGARAHLQEVMSALGRATELIGQLLAVGRRVASSLAEVDVNECAARALERVRAERSTELRSSFTAGAGLPRLLATTDQVERCIASLVTYAAERTGPRGSLALQTLLDTQGSWQRVVLRLDAPDAVVPEDELEHVFEPFYLSAAGRRMGLGLAAARGIASLLGGEISAQRPEAGGVRFSVTLPVKVAKPSAAAAENGGTILLAEDDVGVRDLASRVLGKEGYRVLAARDGEEAVRLFEQNKASIRVAVLDDVMPKLNGRTVRERIRATSPALPVILCTGYAWGAPESLTRSEREETLAKPYDPRDLLRSVRRALGG
ncbi:MAG TPA: response regulator [Spirochaetia bacterium]|nr:response regulator [Spirochaetia bacterium]